MAITAADNSADPYEFTDYLDTKYHSVRGGGYRPPRVAILNHYESERKANTRQSKIANDQIKPLRFLSDRINW